MSSKERTCHLCGTVTDTWCPTCVAAWPDLPSAGDMTGDERAAEMERLLGPLEVPFDMLHERIEHLVGRSVWTHEMGSDWFPALVEEARTRQTVSPREVLRRAASLGKSVVAVQVPE